MQAQLIASNILSRKLIYVFVFVFLLGSIIYLLHGDRSDSKKTKTKVIGGNALQNIPKMIFQTLKAQNSDEYLRRSYDQIYMKSRLSIAKWHPDYEHVVLSDYEQNDWVKKNYPVIYPFYMNFTHDIHRSDFVRFLLIHHYGGFYFDSDVILMQPIDQWYSLDDTGGKNISVLFGIEGDNDKKFLAMNMSNTWRPQQVTSWTFAATPRHPLFEFLIRLILSKKVAKMQNYVAEVAEFASPAVFTDAISAYMLLKGVKMSDLFDAGGNKMVEDMYLANIKAFSCGTMWSLGEFIVRFLLDKTLF
jgi:mannosyltransferase OCH1-like enzyme